MAQNKDQLFGSSLEVFLDSYHLPGNCEWDLGDLALFGSEFLRQYQIGRPGEAQLLIEKSRKSSPAVVSFVPRSITTPEFDYKSVYATRELFSQFTFVHELTSVNDSPPLIFASDKYFLDSHNIVRHRETNHPERASSVLKPSGVRTWFDVNGFIHKSELACIDYLERSQVAQELSFLKTAERRNLPRSLFPQVKRSAVGRTVVELVREAINGRPIRPNDIGDRDVLNGFQSVCNKYAQLGIFHNDLRPWNLIRDEDQVILVDFADTSWRDSDCSKLPQLAAYIGTALVLMGKVSPGQSDFHKLVTDLIGTRFKSVNWTQGWLNLPQSIPLSGIPPRTNLQNVIQTIIDSCACR
jgi:hypothetical protein